MSCHPWFLWCPRFAGIRHRNLWTAFQPQSGEHKGAKSDTVKKTTSSPWKSSFSLNVWNFNHAQGCILYWYIGTEIQARKHTIGKTQQGRTWKCFFHVNSHKFCTHFRWDVWRFTWHARNWRNSQKLKVSELLAEHNKKLKELLSCPETVQT